MRNGRKAHQCVDFFLRQELYRFLLRLRNEFDVPVGIQADIRGHAGKKNMVGRSQLGYRDRFSLEVADGAHAIGSEQFEATYMDAGEEHERVSHVHLHDERRDKCHADVDLAGHEGGIGIGFRDVHVLHIRKTFDPEQLPFGQLLYGDVTPIAVRPFRSGTIQSHRRCAARAM